MFEAGEGAVELPVKVGALAVAHGQAERGIDKRHARLFCAAHKRQDVLLAVRDPREHGHEQDAGGQAGVRQARERIQPGGGGGRMRLDDPGERVVRRGDGQLAQHGRSCVDLAEHVGVPADQVAFGGDGHAEAVGRKQLERVPRELFGALERVVRVAHRAGGHHARPGLAAQVVADDAQRVLLGVHGVKIVVAVTFRAAVAVDAAVRAAAVDIHIIARTEPACAVFGVCDNGFRRDGLHERHRLSKGMRIVYQKNADSGCPDCLRGKKQPPGAPQGASGGLWTAYKQKRTRLQAALLHSPVACL